MSFSPARAMLRACLSDPMALLMAAGTGYMLGYALWLAAPAWRYGPESGAGEWALVPLGALAIAAMALQALNSSLDRDTRRAWAIFAATCFLYVGADVLWIGLGSPDVSIADAGYLLAYPGFLWALLAFPAVLADDDERLPFWLDVATVVLAGTMVVWYFVLGPLAYRADPTDLLGAFIALAYPVGDLVLLLGVGALLVRRRRAGVRRSLGAVAAAMLFLFAGDVLYSYQSLRDTYAAGGLPDLLWGASYYLLIVGGYRQHRHAAGRRLVQASGWQLLGYRFTPYLALTVAYALLLMVSRGEWDNPVGGMILCAVGLTMVAAARQAWTTRENLRLEREASARQSEARFRALVQHSTDLISILDGAGVLRYVSPSLRRTLGYGEEESVGRPLAELIHPEDAERVLGALLHPGGRGAPTVVYRLRHRDGSWRHVETIGSDRRSDPEIGGIVLNTRDISERVALEEQLTHQAFHDPLTGLANRALFRDRLEHALSREKRQHEGLAVIFLDLDDFKSVNDGMGHAQGDRLLSSVALRLLHSTRGCDTVARLGGDEFAILLVSVEEDAQAMVVAERIIANLRTPVELGEKEVRVSASLGIARAAPGEEADELLRNADVAMYEAKRMGKGQVVQYRPEMHTAVLDRLELEDDLRRAVEERPEELHLLFQPIVDLASCQVTSVETLARWTHPRRGAVPPLVFIPIAEQSDLIVRLGRWILAEACRQASTWEAGPATAGGAPPAVTVNISGRQLRHPGFAGEVAGILLDTGLPPERLILEITESVLLDHTAPSIQALHALRATGVQLAIDDFGTGYSSLSYLQSLPVNILKIDKSFVDDIASGSQSAALARTIVALGETLSLRTVAEGIERDDQLELLKGMGCRFGQGYHFFRPMSGSGVVTLLREGAPLLA